MGGGTRALLGDDEKTNDGEFDDSNKEDLTGEETRVKQVYFYFFKEGNAAPVEYSTGASWKKYDVAADGFGDQGNEAPNVEHKLKSTLVIHRSYRSSEGDVVKAALPDKVIAILNPSEDLVKTLGNTPSLSDVKEKLVNELAIYEDKTDKKKLFLMSNSVYADNIEVDAVVIPIDSFNEDKDVAINNPITIYVERVVAKLNVNIKETDSSNPNDYWDGETKNQPKMKKVTIGGKDVYNTYVEYAPGKYAYVELLGWNVTATADKSYLVKHIDPTWKNSYTDADNLFKTQYEPWNYENYYRSFWGYNPTDVSLQYGTYSEKPTTLFPNDGNNVNPILPANKFDGTTNVYLPENAGEGKGESNAANKESSKVIIAAQLVDDEGNVLNLTEFLGVKYVDDANHSKVIAAIINTMPKTYFVKKEGTTDQYRTLDYRDVVVKTAWGMAGANKMPNEDRYFINIQLKEGVELYTVKDNVTIPDNKELPEGSLERVEGNTSVNEELARYSAKIWNEGKTYYYLDIRHLANPEAPAMQNESTPGWFGVVRNHIYKVNLTGIFGLGTPVFDPDEIIIPEKPEEKDVYLAAEINILSWRIVDHGYDLNW